MPTNIIYETQCCDKLARIKTIDHRDRPMTVKLHRELYDAAMEINGKHRTAILYELALCWRRFLADGKFSVSTSVLNHIHGQRMRIRFIQLLERCCNTVEKHSAYAGNSRCAARAFDLPGIEKRTTYIQSTSSPSLAILCCETGLMVEVTIPGDWLWERYERWDQYCIENDFENPVDLDGRTSRGKPQHEFMQSIELPVNDETERFTQRGVALRTVVKDRCYDNLSNLSKHSRRQSLVNGERIVEIDISSAFTAILASELHDSSARGEVVAEINDGWYAQFEGAFRSHMESLRESSLAYKDSKGGWWRRAKPADGTKRLKGDKRTDVKVEYQRQCLFFHDYRDTSAPLREVLRERHPELYALVMRYRDRLSASEFSKRLQRSERAMVIDGAVSALGREGIAVKGNHDGLLCGESDAGRVYEVLHEQVTWYLGFAPMIKRK